HHPHSLEIASEADRVRPFGTAASVLYPYRDVRVRNDLDQAVALAARCDGHTLSLDLRTPALPAVVCLLEERGYVATAGPPPARAGQLWQICRDRRTGRVVGERCVLAGEVKVLADLPGNHCYTCDRVCPNAIPSSHPDARAARAELNLLR